MYVCMYVCIYIYIYIYIYSTVAILSALALCYPNAVCSAVA